MNNRFMANVWYKASNLLINRGFWVVSIRRLRTNNIFLMFPRCHYHENRFGRLRFTLNFRVPKLSLIAFLWCGNLFTGPFQALSQPYSWKPQHDKTRKRFRQSTSDKKPEKRISKERIYSPARKPETGKDDFFWKELKIGLGLRGEI